MANEGIVPLPHCHRYDFGETPAAVSRNIHRCPARCKRHFENVAAHAYRIVERALCQPGRYDAAGQVNHNDSVRVDKGMRWCGQFVVGRQRRKREPSARYVIGFPQQIAAGQSVVNAKADDVAPGAGSLGKGDSGGVGNGISSGGIAEVTCADRHTSIAVAARFCRRLDRRKER